MQNTYKSKRTLDSNKLRKELTNDLYIYLLFFVF